MMFFAIVPVLVGTLIATVLGMFWFSQMMFGGAWMRLTGVSMEGGDPSKKKAMIKGYATNIAISFVTSLVIYILLSVGFDLVGIFAVWIGFALPGYATPSIWEGKSWKLFFITAGYSLVSATFIAQVLGMWLY